MWANYEYFMRAVLPVAEEAGVKLALHPDDPPVPMLGGVARLFRNVEGFKRAEADRADAATAWGLDLCLGCCSEMPGGAANVHGDDRALRPARADPLRPLPRRPGHRARPSQECFLGEGNYDPAATMLLA